MKKIISLILAIVMVAAMAPMMISADTDEILTEDATGFVEEYQKWEITKKYFALEYIFDLEERAGANKEENGVSGLWLADGNACAAFVYDGTGLEGPQKDLWCSIWGRKINNDGEYWPDVTGYGTNFNGHMLVFGPWWTTQDTTASDYTVWGDERNRGMLGVSSYYGQEVKLTLVGSLDKGTLKVRGYFNGQPIKVWGETYEFVCEDYSGKVGYSTKLTDAKATAKFVQSDKKLDVNAFGDSFKTIKSGTAGKVGAILGDWEVDGSTYLPKTGSIGSSGAYYQLGEGNKYEVSATFKIDGEKGFIFGVQDFNGDGKITETEDYYYLLDIASNGWVCFTRNNAQWGGWMNDLNSSGKGAGEEVTIKATMDNGQLTVYADGKQIFTYKTVSSANAFGLWSKGENVPFTNVEVKIENDPEPVAPKTGEAGAFVALIALFSLGATVVISKKRH